MVSPSMQAEADHPRVTDPQERAPAQTLAQPPEARREVDHCGGRLNSITMFAFGRGSWRRKTLPELLVT